MLYAEELITVEKLPLEFVVPKTGIWFPAKSKTLTFGSPVKFICILSPFPVLETERTGAIANAKVKFKKRNPVITVATLQEIDCLNLIIFFNLDNALIILLYCIIKNTI